MNVVLIYTYFYKMDLIPLFYTDTYLLKCILYLFRKYFPTVFGRAYQMV